MNRLWSWRLLRLAGNSCVTISVGLLDLLLLSLAPGGGLFVGFVKDDAGDTFELRTDSEHAFDAAILFIGTEKAQEAHDVVHKLQVRPCSSILRVLQDIGEQSHERGDWVI